MKSIGSTTPEKQNLTDSRKIINKKMGKTVL